MKLKKEKASILIIYTGGTIGMIENPETGVLESFNFKHLENNVPELKALGHDVHTVQYEPPVDSSEMGPEHWRRIVKTISEEYDNYDGFVVLHGTDTMAYTASALSFMLQGLNKPVVLTGSQLPIGMLRTDGKENMITAIEIAAARENGVAIVPEVSIFFQNYLLRGNRTSKISAEHFSAFQSFNYPPLARAGIDIKYDYSAIKKLNKKDKLSPRFEMDTHVAILKLFPGITPEVVHGVLNIPGLKGVVMETFGSGNAPCSEWFLTQLKEAVARGLVIVNVTQCQSGHVEMQRYETGNKLLQIGVISGFDSTTESALAKLMYLFGSGYNVSKVKELMETNMVGEISINID